MSIGKSIASVCKECGFNGSVLVAKEKDILYLDSFGYKDIKHKIRLDENCIFRIGSITKQFTAVAILQLVEKGICNLSDTIDKYIDNVPYEQKISIHQLLANCSGIPNFNPFEDYSEHLHSQNFHLSMIDKVIFPLPLSFDPGTKFEYSAGGYLILTYLIELLSKQTYAEYLQEHIFSLLEMNHTGFCFNEVTLPEFTSLYDVIDGEIVEAKDIDMRIASGGGGLYSSINDLFKWNRALINCQILSSQHKEMMFSVQTRINDRGGYGYGVISVEIQENDKPHRLVYHPGNGPGAYAHNNIIDDNIQLIILSNINDGTTFNRCFDKVLNIVRRTLL
ncbi:MAG: beta-lactamase family protein [Bacilli bacterium]|nr:beta-lactamase family protein [Bacilli bacterium]